MTLRIEVDSVTARTWMLSAFALTLMSIRWQVGTVIVYGLKDMRVRGLRIGKSSGRVDLGFGIAIPKEKAESWSWQCRSV